MANKGTKTTKDGRTPLVAMQLPCGGHFVLSSNSKQHSYVGDSGSNHISIKWEALATYSYV